MPRCLVVRRFEDGANIRNALRCRSPRDDRLHAGYDPCHAVPRAPLRAVVIPRDTTRHRIAGVDGEFNIPARPRDVGSDRRNPSEARLEREVPRVRPEQRGILATAFRLATSRRAGSATDQEPWRVSAPRDRGCGISSTGLVSLPFTPSEHDRVALDDREDVLMCADAPASCLSHHLCGAAPAHRGGGASGRHRAPHRTGRRRRSP